MSATVTEKSCSRCKRVKPASEFPIDRSMKSCLYSHCKDCTNANGKKRYVDPTVRAKVLKYQSDYRKHFPERKKATTKKYRSANAQKIWEQNREYYDRPQVKERIKLWAREYRKKPLVKIAMNCRRRIRTVLNSKSKKGNGRLLKYLGLTSVAQLKLHLESQFKQGMSWENYGRWGWHIDHIKPLSLFNLNKESEIKQALHYTNLQPLWWSENVSKNNRRVG